MFSWEVIATGVRVNPPFPLPFLTPSVCWGIQQRAEQRIKHLHLIKVAFEQVMVETVKSVMQGAHVLHCRGHPQRDFCSGVSAASLPK